LRRAEDFNKFWECFSKSKRFSYFSVSAKSVLSRIHKKGTPSFRTVFEAVLEEYASVNKKPRWGEKTPAHYDYIDILLSWFPAGRIIWVVRDPRAVCASYMKVPWSVKHVLGPARRWVKSMRELSRWQGDSRVRVVKYENLVTNQQQTMLGVFTFLGE
jgi:hypothetical protein